MTKELALKLDPKNAREKRREKSAERVKQIKKLRATGMTYRRIMAVLDTSYGTVFRAISGTRDRYDAKQAAAYYEAHCEKKKAQSAAYRVTHREAIKAQRAFFYSTHKEEQRKRDRKYHATHRAIRSERARRWRENHKTEIYLHNALRKALVAGSAVGNLVEIKEIYRRAKEDPKVRCYLCGRLIPQGHRHVDHITPLAKGGAHRSSNLAVACDKCNLEKSAKLPEEIGLLL